MLCIECGSPVPSLYKTYKNGHIKLTDCGVCGKVCDKYVEFDNVLLFIDVLLMKPQAYKHLVFNVLGAGSRGSHYVVQRLRLMSILLEIYLTWAYEEKRFHNAMDDHQSVIYQLILAKTDVMSQYLFFGLKCFLEDILTHSLLQWMIYTVFQWSPPATTPFYDPISLTIVIASGTRLFPIVMLIWPYEDHSTTQSIQQVITVLSSVTLIEALRLVTGLPLLQSLLLCTLLAVLRTTATRTVLLLLLTQGSTRQFAQLAREECAHLTDFLLVK